MNDTVCPKCEHNQMKKGTIRVGNGAAVHMFPHDNPRSQSSPITSYFCLNCGYIFELYVEKPANLDS
ncbi:Nucleic-acid-binding protein containing Zn-ribbon domain [Oceanobacillus limi]|uniref:Nucleic-acid-binding protein containing Zn-ribbon domain n=1 Tax=Oceanobacillus limi TaxID=930131 RepID=A0A1H9Y9C1_9BACI|nr:zinc ribbon domain-containing protein [Oceanobacillus limi]SES65428.1 Nucleic-acid-binding protein containing Zn-ribbon domain [Oceanobacillus limi]